MWPDTHKMDVVRERAAPEEVQPKAQSTAACRRSQGVWQRWLGWKQPLQLSSCCSRCHSHHGSTCHRFPQQRAQHAAQGQPHQDGEAAHPSHGQRCTCRHAGTSLVRSNLGTSWSCTACAAVQELGAAGQLLVLGLQACSVQISQARHSGLKASRAEHPSTAACDQGRVMGMAARTRHARAL